jgi:Zn-finger nucleic acid-binding protein
MSEAALECPRCLTPMTPVTLTGGPNVVIDRCPRCLGFWLDSGELRALQKHAADLDAEKMARMRKISTAHVGEDGGEAAVILLAMDGGFADCGHGQ